MIISLRKIGNSRGIVIPAPLLQQLKSNRPDTKFEGNIVKGKLVLEPVREMKKYSLASLLDKCNVSAPMPEDLAEWDKIRPLGNEL